MMAEYGGWSKMTLAPREATSSSESFAQSLEQSQRPKLSRTAQRANTQNAFRRDLHNSSPLSMCSASDDGASDGDVHQVRMLKTAEDVSIDRQKTHSALLLANVSLKKQAYDTAMQMATRFPNNPSWEKKLEQAASEYMTACQGDVMAPPPTDWARPQRFETPGPFLTPEPQRPKRQHSDEDAAVHSAHTLEASLDESERVEELDFEPEEAIIDYVHEDLPDLLHGCDVCRCTYEQLKQQAADNEDGPAVWYELRMCLMNPTNVNNLPETCTRVVCGKCELTRDHPWDENEARGRWCRTHCNPLFTVSEGTILQKYDHRAAKPDPPRSESAPRKRGRPSKPIAASRVATGALTTMLESRCAYAKLGFGCIPTDHKCRTKPCSNYVCDSCAARVNPANETEGHYCPEHFSA